MSFSIVRNWRGVATGHGMVVRFALSILVCVVVGGCATRSVKQGPGQEAAAKPGDVPFKLVLSRPKSGFGTGVRLHVRANGRTIAKIGDGDSVVVDLPAGTYDISVKLGLVLGSDFPKASAHLEGKAGEVLGCEYVMEFGPRVISYSIGSGVDMSALVAAPSSAVWRQLDSEAVARMTAR